ncbi:unnamed protein product [Dicrocoelium dendriticum]|nr:unnamed protein product [Dicrocoelium dendriticum]
MVKHLFYCPMSLLAIEIYHALKYSRAAHQVLTNILCCLNNSEVHRLKKAYADHLEQQYGLRGKFMYIYWF